MALFPSLAACRVKDPGLRIFSQGLVSRALGLKSSMSQLKRSSGRGFPGWILVQYQLRKSPKLWRHCARHPYAGFKAPVEGCLFRAPVSMDQVPDAECKHPCTGFKAPVERCRFQAREKKCRRAKLWKKGASYFGKLSCP